MDFKIGDVLEGEVTGIQHYGVFVKLSDDEQGLVHISECKHGFMTDMGDFISIGDKVKVMIIDIDEYNHKISLSMRALTKLNTPPFPARYKKHRKRYLQGAGFESLERKLPQWVHAALEDIEEDAYGIYRRNEKKQKGEKEHESSDSI